MTTWEGGSALKDDGVSLGRCDRDLLLAYRRHQKIPPHLAGVHLGSMEEAREWLVMDTLQHLLSVAPPKEARRHLAEQWPRYQEQALEYTPEELAHLLSGLEATSSDQAARRAEALRESQANDKWLLQWLDEQGGPPA